MQATTRRKEYWENRLDRGRVYKCRKCGDSFTKYLVNPLSENERICDRCKGDEMVTTEIKTTTEYKIVTIDKLQPFLIRGIREGVLEQLRERIKAGFNPARPLTVVPVEGNGHYIVADGNHRLQALYDLGITEVPVVIRNEDAYTLAVKCNCDEDTYAPMDLFDWLDVVRQLRDDGLTQEKIGEKIGWERGRVSQYQMILDKIATNILEMAKQKQSGRVAENATTVTMNFTERWFRDSCLYDLQPKYQERLIKEFISDKFNWRKEKVQSEASKYKSWQQFSDIAKAELVNGDDYPTILTMIENGTFKTDVQLRQKIKDLNTQAKSKLICGDCVIELEQLDDASIDIVITDPPYGIDYSSNHSIYNDYVTKGTISGDKDLSTALNVIDRVLNTLQTKTKPDCHVYIFTSWKVYPAFLPVVEKYFSVKNLIVWDKGNWSMGDLECAWGNQYEMIIYASKGKKILKRRGDIINVARVPTTQAIHPTQKPVELIKELLKVSAQPADTVCDPFMGSGSTIKAVKEHGNLNYIGIEIDKENFNKAKAYIG